MAGEKVDTPVVEGVETTKEAAAEAPVTGIIPGQCCIPPPPSDYQGLGSEETWEPLPVYLTGSTSSASAVVFVCDIYGWQVPQTRRLADKLAAAGHFVVLPDFLENDFFSSPDPENAYAGLPDFLARHPQPKVIEEATKVIEKLKSMGLQTIGLTGFCWGAKIVVSLLRGDKPGVAAGVMCHPSFITVEEIQAVKIPLAVLAAEIDIITPPDLAEKFRIALAASPEVGSKSYVKLFKGADHGWTTRYDLEDPEASKRAETAHQDIIDWFKTYLLH